MKRIIVDVMSTVLLMAWSTVTPAETSNQRLREMLFGKGQQSPQPGGTIKPWQTSWESFCAELKRLYSQEVPPPDEINALFAGKQVTWEGDINGIDLEKRSVTLRMPDCRVTTGAGKSAAEVLPIPLDFENPSEMEQSFNRIGLRGDPKTWGQQLFQRKDAYALFQKVRFTTTLEPVEFIAVKLPAVSWEHFTDEKEGVERNQISIYTGHARLLGQASGSSR